MNLQVCHAAASAQYALQVPLTHTVLQLKEQLAQLAGALPAQMKLVHRSHILANSRTVASYGLPQDAKVMLFVSAAQRSVRPPEAGVALGINRREPCSDLDPASPSAQEEEPGHDVQVLASLLRTIEITPELIKEKLSQSPAIQYMAANHAGFSEFISSDAVAEQFCKLLSSPAKLAQLLQGREQARARLLQADTDDSFVKDYRDFALRQ